MEWYNDPDYIEMCMKAIRLQENWQPTIGDWVYTIIGNEIGCIARVRPSDKDTFALHNSGYGTEVHKSAGILIFSQPQLQNMIKSDCSCGIEWLHQGTEISSFANYLTEMETKRELKFYTEEKNYGIQVKTWEQFWLCLVMNIIYGKDWNGFDFVKVGEENE